MLLIFVKVKEWNLAEALEGVEARAPPNNLRRTTVAVRVVDGS